MRDRTSDDEICLTADEALGLLDIVMMCPTELSPEQHSAVLKLSEFCRKCLRDGAPQRFTEKIPAVAAPAAVKTACAA